MNEKLANLKSTVDQHRAEKDSALTKLRESMNHNFAQVLKRLNMDASSTNKALSIDKKSQNDAIILEDTSSFRIMPFDESLKFHSYCLNSRDNLAEIIQASEVLSCMDEVTRSQVITGSASMVLKFDKHYSPRGTNQRGLVVQCLTPHLANCIKKILRSDNQTSTLRITQVRSKFEHINKMRSLVHDMLFPYLQTGNKTGPIKYFWTKYHQFLLEGQQTLGIKILIKLSDDTMVNLSHTVPKYGAKHSCLDGGRGGHLDFSLSHDQDAPTPILNQHSIKPALLQALQDSSFLSHPDFLKMNPTPMNPAPPHQKPLTNIQTTYVSQPQLPSNMVFPHPLQTPTHLPHPHWVNSHPNIPRVPQPQSFHPSRPLIHPNPVQHIPTYQTLSPAPQNTPPFNSSLPNIQFPSLTISPHNVPITPQSSPTQNQVSQLQLPDQSTPTDQMKKGGQPPFTQLKSKKSKGSVKSRKSARLKGQNSDSQHIKKFFHPRHHNPEIDL